MSGMLEITPEGSVAPVFRTAEPIDLGPGEPHVVEVIDATLEARSSGMAKLMALGLTEAEAAAIAGGSA